MGDTANAGSIRASIDFDAAGLEAAVTKAMQKATAHIDSSIDKSMAHVEGRISQGFKNAGKSAVAALGIGGIVDSLVRAGGYILKVGKQTESALNTFKAVSGATADQMKQVSEAANQLGNDIALPGVSAADASEAMTELAKAGFSIDESMAAAKGSLELATAAQVGAGDAAAIAAEQINAFGLKAADAGHVADVLANAANISAADMEGMADSLKQAGAVANSAGLGFEETSAAIALMANNSIQGSDAGTSLKSMLVALEAPSDKAAQIMKDLGIEVYDNQGRMKDLAGIIEAVTKGTEGLTDKQKQYALATIFGTDAIRSVNVLMHEGADGIRELTEGLGKEGAAAKLAAANSKGLVGSLGALQSTIESVAIEIYQNVSPAMDKWLRGVLKDLPGVLDEAAVYVGELVDSLEPAARVVGEFISAAKPGAIIAFKAGLAVLLGVLKATALVLEPVADFMEDNEAALRTIVGPLVAATIAYKVFSKAVGSASAFRTKAIEAYTVKVDGLKAKFAGATSAASRMRVVGSGLMGAVGGPWGAALIAGTAVLGYYAAKHADAAAKAQQLKDTLNEQTGAITKNTYAWAAQQLVDEGVVDDIKALGLSSRDVIDAMLDLSDAGDQAYAAVFNLAAGNTAASDAEREHANAIYDVIRADSSRVKGYRNAIEAQRLTIQVTNEANGKMKQSAEAAASAKARAAKIEEQLTGRVQTTSRSLDRQKRAALGTKAAIESLNNEAIKGLNAQIDFEQATDDLTKQIKSLSPAAIKSGKALDLGSQAGRDTYRAFIAVANASGEVSGGMQRARAQIFNVINGMVHNKAEAKRLTDQFFNLKTAADRIPNRVSTRVDAPGLENTYARLVSLKGLYNGLDGRVVRTHIINVQTHIDERLRRASGGAVFGPGSGTSDSIPALLSNGEHVFTAREVEAAGGHGNILRLRKAILAGQVAFAGGGAVAPGRQSNTAHPVEVGRSSALVENLSVEVGKKDDLPDALDETLFHLRRIRRGGRYATHG